MRRTRSFIPALTLLSLLCGKLESQPNKFFYDIKKEIQVTGTIERLMFERKYSDSAPFLSLEIEENGTRMRYIVEVSPAWFFEPDLHKGERVTIFGSLIVRGENNRIMARMLRYRGRETSVRDRNGFPNWRRGKGRRRSRIRRVNDPPSRP